jgi:DNA-binding transcriptional regulator YiaG
MNPTMMSNWKPGMDLPYVLSLAPGRFLAISLPAAWLKADPSGKPLLLPPAVRALERVRAVFAQQASITPGFIVRLREALDLTQTQFGRKLRVSKMTVSRWECGRIHPSPAAIRKLHLLQSQARRAGVTIDGEKQPGHAHAQRANAA